tara:strand:- start:1053 stop:1445 length:393 start_codon:yes stop_codon:yes gene_type:complete
MTPHAINLMTESGKSIATFEPSGSTIRLDEEWSPIGSFGIHSETFDDTMVVPLLHCVYGSGSIPEPVEGTIFIVSALVANAYPDRRDFVMVAKTVRDENGRIIGCTGFAAAEDWGATQIYGCTCECHEEE